MSKNYVPLYRNSFDEAQRNGEMDLYNQSHRENIACANAIKKALADNFNGYHLNVGIEKKIIEDFGFDRTMYVLANTIQHFNYDGRISVYNKDWADTVFIPENKESRINRNMEFLIDSPGLVNIFANAFRERYRELDLWGDIHCINSSDLDFTGKVMVLNPSLLKDEYKKPDCQLFYCKSGFGCSPTARGQKVFGEYLIDGEKTSYERSDFIGELKPGLLPKWAQDKLKDLQKPSIKKQLADMPQSKSQSKNIKDKGAR